jgi:hypothetical protein
MVLLSLVLAYGCRQDVQPVASQPASEQPATKPCEPQKDIPSKPVGKESKPPTFEPSTAPKPTDAATPWIRPPKEVFDYDSPPQIIIMAPEVPERIKGPFPQIPEKPSRGSFP